MTYPPPPLQQPVEPPRRSRPWWVWLLGGCAACSVIAVIAAIVVGVSLYRGVSSAMKSVGPVTTASVQQDLGSDVPLYPGSTLDPMTTRTTKVLFRSIEQAAGQAGGSIFRGVSVSFTNDSPQKVFAFYEKELPAAGWSRDRSGGGSPQQRAFRKGQEMLIVQSQVQPQGTMVMIMRGGSRMREHAPSRP